MTESFEKGWREMFDRIRAYRSPPPLGPDRKKAEITQRRLGGRCDSCGAECKVCKRPEWDPAPFHQWLDETGGLGQ